MLESGQILAARYTLLRKLAGGGATQLWHVRDREAAVDRVIKVLVSASPAQRARFLASAHLQGQVRHPNVQPCETVVDGDPAFAVFPAVAPGDLSSLRGRPWRELLPVLAAIADGLAALHGHGIVHRDLKPANVLLGTDGEPWLAATMSTTRSSSSSGEPRWRRMVGLGSRIGLISSMTSSTTYVSSFVVSPRSEPIPDSVISWPKPEVMPWFPPMRIIASYAVLACTQKHSRISLPNSRDMPRRRDSCQYGSRYWSKRPKLTPGPG